MDANRWALLSPLLDELLELDEALRARRLQQLQEGEPALASELRGLLAMEQCSEAFMAQPLLGSRDQQAVAGDRVGTYRLIRALGEGGAGQVWLAHDERGGDGRRVALKLMRADLADPHLRARFLRECRMLGALSHPRIPRLLDAGETRDGQLYLALEYVCGQAITDYCQHHDYSPQRCTALFLHVCAALEYVHAQGIVHRDLKPSNILVDGSGCARLLDFGIACHLDEPPVATTADAPRTFTLHYAAPEQIRGEAVSPATDVYSLGVVLYELLTGQKPYRLRRQSDAEWERAVLRAEVAAPSLIVQRCEGVQAALRERRSACLRGGLDTIVLKALQKSPRDRYRSVTALAADLRCWQRDQPAAAPPDRRPPPWLRWLRDTQRLVAGL
ncbi:MAG TPA: serine/threonine-protein kinase [Stenotrophomonas sp.]|nr:serine/threonine-protein kinase [Stenotrophomonas sp.]